MSDAADRLSRSRRAILDEIQLRDRSSGSASARRWRAQSDGGEPEDADELRGRASGWLPRLRRAARTWWRHHPAHMGLELATPALSAFADRKPLQFLGIAAAAGALLVIARPWRLVSVTGLLIAVAKSSQLSTVLLSALSAADFQGDQERQE